MVVKVQGSEFNHALPIGKSVNGKKIVGYTKRNYITECERCGNIENHVLEHIRRLAPFCCNCRLYAATVKNKKLIAEILEMYFGQGLMAPFIARHFNMDSSAVSWAITRHGFKLREGFILTLNSKI